jgi:UDP-N-acetylglucosamine 2-epimerase (non-hydrolysing)
MRILSVTELVKTAPIIRRWAANRPDWSHVLGPTGWHCDPMMSEIFLEQLGVPEPDHMLGSAQAVTLSRLGV